MILIHRGLMSLPAAAQPYIRHNHHQKKSRWLSVAAITESPILQFAFHTGAAKPANSYSLTNLPAGNISPSLSRYQPLRVRGLWDIGCLEMSLFNYRISVANATSMDFRRTSFSLGNGSSFWTNSKSPPGLLICIAFINGISSPSC